MTDKLCTTKAVNIGGSPPQGGKIAIAQYAIRADYNPRHGEIENVLMRGAAAHAGTRGELGKTLSVGVGSTKPSRH
jgi:hypothetical protein